MNFVSVHVGADFKTHRHANACACKVVRLHVCARTQSKGAISANTEMSKICLVQIIRVTIKLLRFNCMLKFEFIFPLDGKL